jgi:3'(2'), 5'-bisphosphate nucleotidase
MTLPDIGTILAIARQAGDAILTVYGSDFAVQTKEDRSPLTEADLAAHRIILDALARLTPDIPVLSEESAATDWSVRRAWRAYWLVDPLDGTREFVKRNGEFTVNIALIQDGVAVLGVVHAPVLGVSYFGGAGLGAFRQQGAETPRPIQVATPAEHPLRVVGSRSHAGDSLTAVLDRIGAHRLVGMGSSLKLCLVADGSADFYPRLGPTSEWDTAAAQAVVEGAGGQVWDTQGHRLVYNSKESLLNPFFLVLGDATIPWLDYL